MHSDRSDTEVGAFDLRGKHSTSAGAYRVLLIEDSPSDAAAIRDMLAHDPVGSSFVVANAQTLAEGISSAGSTAFDIVMLDLNLPDSTGYQTFEAALGAIRRVPIVVLTSIGGEDIAAAAVSNGAQDFVCKDRVDSFWLGQTIRRAVSRYQLVARVTQAEEREMAAIKRAIQAKSDFLAAISHDIRTPISAIIMTSEILQQADLDPAERISLSTLLQANGQHLLDLVNDVLDLSRVEAGCVALEFVPVRLRDLLFEIHRTFAPLAKRKGLALELEVDGDVPMSFTCDPRRLRQMISNLLSNAIKFTESGRVVLSVAATSLSSDPRIVIRVEDTGVGIPADAVDDLFQPYAQGDAKVERLYGGSGLGLMLSRKLAEALGGSLVLKESRVGRGSVFELSLPNRNPKTVERAALPVDRGQLH